MRVALLLTLSLAAALGPSTDVVSRVRWSMWKNQYSKSYATAEEEASRFEIFKQNLAIIAEKNGNRPAPESALFGTTKFADLTTDEFAEKFLMNKEILARPQQSARQENVFEETLPASFDWNSKGVVTPVKNQGQCGSCWDFSATETIESVCAIAGYTLTTLSEQQILDCDSNDYGCDGGWPYSAYQYVISAGGLDTEANYPYTGEDGSCTFSSQGLYDCPVINWQYVEQSSNEGSMQQFLYSNSPLSVCVDAAQWQFYSSGVFMGSQCGTDIDHCVQATGWSVQGGYNVWNVRNSWGTDWGVSGYIYVQMGVDACAIAQEVTVPCVRAPNGQTVC